MILSYITIIIGNNKCSAHSAPSNRFLESRAESDGGYLAINGDRSAVAECRTLESCLGRRKD